MAKNTVTYQIGNVSPSLAVSSWVKPANEVAYKYSDSGAVTVSALSRKAWKDTTGSALVGNALKRAHNEYLRQVGIDGNAYVAEAIAKGHILVSSIGANKSGKGLNVKFTNSLAVVDPSPSKSAEVKEAKKSGKLDLLKQLLADGAINQAAYDAASAII